jgi:hypothetical protein
MAFNTWNTWNWIYDTDVFDNIKVYTLKHAFACSIMVAGGQEGLVSLLHRRGPKTENIIHYHDVNINDAQWVAIPGRPVWQGP